MRASLSHRIAKLLPNKRPSPAESSAVHLPKADVYLEVMCFTSPLKRKAFPFSTHSTVPAGNTLHKIVASQYMKGRKLNLWDTKPSQANWQCCHQIRETSGRK